MQIQPLHILIVSLLLLGVLFVKSAVAQSPNPASAPNEMPPLDSSLTVNVNTASAEDLAEVLNGVGLSRARSIVEWRTDNGHFSDPYDLVQVRGISERIVSLNEARIRVADRDDSGDG